MNGKPMNRRPRTSVVRVAALGVGLALLGVGCGGSGGGVTDPTSSATDPPPPEPEPPSQTEVWQEQPSGVSGAISRVQFMDETTGVAVQRNRQGRSLTLLRTSDGGASWSASVISSSQATDMGHFLAFTDANTGFTGGEACTLVSTDDGGESWTSRRICGSTRWLLSIAVVDGSRVWLGGGGGMVFRSLDGGAGWTQVHVPELTEPVTGIAFAGPDVGLMVDSGTGDVFRTVDGGTSWERRPGVPADLSSRLSTVAFSDDRIAVAVGERGTVLRTTDAGESWSVAQSGVVDDLTDVDFGAEGFGVAVGASGAILVTEDAGATWTRESSPNPTFLAGVSVLDADHAWIVGDGGTILTRDAP